MLRFILTRLSLVIPTFIGMTLVAFLMIRLVPGDPIDRARHPRVFGWSIALESASLLAAKSLNPGALTVRIKD